MFDPHADPHGERTVRSQGAKSAADLILLEKKGRKALEYKDWKAPNQLVRSRSSSTDILWTLCGRRSRKTLRQKDYPAFPMARVSFIGCGSEEDFSNMWAILMALLRTDG